jgi:hypothetical protein
VARRATVSTAARALVLTPLAESEIYVTLAVELPDGSTAASVVGWRHPRYRGVVVPGTWIPVRLPDGRADRAELAQDQVPLDSEVAEVIVEALGGPAATPRSADVWRIQLALAYAERIIEAGGLGEDQADAIRQRIKAGV